MVWLSHQRACRVLTHYANHMLTPEERAERGYGSSLPNNGGMHADSLPHMAEAWATLHQRHNIFFSVPPHVHGYDGDDG